MLFEKEMSLFSKKKPDTWSNIVLLRCLIWSDQAKFWSTETPKILSLEIILSDSSLNLRSKIYASSLCHFWFVVTSMIFVLDELRSIPLHQYQVLRLSKSICRLFSIYSTELWMSYKVVSSAYRSVLTLLTYRGKSLIKKYKRGSKIDPCGTPYRTCPISDLLLLT